MGRAAAQIVVDIQAFQPSSGDWRRLDDLLGELWATGDASRHIPDLLAVLERFPVDHGAGVLWSVVHGVESLPGYAPDLIRSVRRQPSELGVTMVGRFLNGGVSQVGRESLVGLLREVTASATAPESVRAFAADWADRHAEPGAKANRPRN
jgi:hypothetical protein